ncbi:DUF3038 domain-containing protein [Chamaesiphon sp. VAR_48_metabat_403]|uniref:DUF3038 domain-containing protein n=1 Tax=Chamaesiphon sp. VAR_48_metabat_403 TaxID=2964700 RepID=UPI00286E3BFC|nr:DUF3038 domain-containing protein [Chamaesiphon sp. VAR_48_metabat_403]
MFSREMMPASTPKLDDLLLTAKLDSSQLERITAELNAISMAIAALAPLDRVELRKIAQDLQVAAIVSDWIDDWPLERAGLPEQYNIQQIRALVLIVHHLAQQHQPLVRRNIDDWQQTIQADRLPLQSPQLADYIGNFITMYQDRSGGAGNLSFEELAETALNLTLGLLFYGSPNGHQRLWGALLQRSQ